MIPEIEKKYNDRIFEDALSRYGIKKSDTNDLGGFESFVYEYKKGDKEFILKITHSIRRTENYIMGEVEFVNYLADNGIPTARVIRSNNDRFVEIIQETEDEYFMAYAFEKIYGEEPGEDGLPENVIFKLGKITGQMHSLTKKYKLSDLAYKREKWNDTDLLVNYEKYLPKNSELLSERIKDTINKINLYPVNKDTFGLIHGDLHTDNFFIRKNDLGIIDFDDMEYHYFISDLAVSLYYSTPKDNNKRIEFADLFMKNYLKGYRIHNEIDNEWLSAIPDFLKLRDVLLAIVIYQAFDFTKISEDQRARFTRRIQNIENNVPVIDMNFSKYEN